MGAGVLADLLKGDVGWGHTQHQQIRQGHPIEGNRECGARLQDFEVDCAPGGSVADNHPVAADHPLIDELCA